MTSIPLQNVNTTNTIVWVGASGTRYEFNNYPIGTVFRGVPGVYVFSRLHDGLFYSVYVGETDDFSRRLTDELAGHHQGPSIARHGATHISVRIVAGGLSERLRIETDLRHGLNPPCNKQ